MALTEAAKSSYMGCSHWLWQRAAWERCVRMIQKCPTTEHKHLECLDKVGEDSRLFVLELAYLLGGGALMGLGEIL